MAAPDDDEPISVDEARLTLGHGQLASMADRLARHRRWISLTSLFEHLAPLDVPLPILTETVQAVARVLREQPKRRGDRQSSGTGETFRTLRILAGEALLRRIPRPAMTAPERVSLAVVGGVFADAGDLYRAANAYQDADHWAEAADAWGRLGDLDAMEACLARDENERHAKRTTRGTMRDIEALMLDGQRRAALRLLESLGDGSPDATDARSLRLDLSSRLVRGRGVGLRLPDDRRVRVASLPAVLGRDTQSDLFLRDPGVSRQHARFERVGDQIAIVDVGSRAGTFVGGARLAGTFVLKGDSEIRLGPTCALEARLPEIDGVSPRLLLRGLTGFDRTFVAAIGLGPVPLGEFLPEAAGVSLQWTKDGVQLHHAPGVVVRVAGQHASMNVDLLHGDVVDIGDGFRIEIE